MLPNSCVIVKFDQLQHAATQVVSSTAAVPQEIVVSGSGEFLARRLTERISSCEHVVSLEEKLGPTVSACAPAHALAVLASEKDVPWTATAS